MNNRNRDREVAKTRTVNKKTGEMRRGGTKKKKNRRALSPALVIKQVPLAPSTFSTFTSNSDHHPMPFNEAMLFPNLYKDSPGYKESAELDAFWTVGFVDEANRSRMRQMQKEIKSSTGLYGFTSVAECRLALSDSSELNFNVSTYKGGCSLTDNERNRLDELEQRLEKNEAARNSKMIRKAESKGRDGKGENSMKQTRKQIKVYKNSNEKLRRFQGCNSYTSISKRNNWKEKSVQREETPSSDLHRAHLARAIKVQILARSLVARRVVQLRRRVFTTAAIRIQRAYRGFSSRQIISKLIYDRETSNRRDKIRSLAAEEDSMMEYIIVMEKRLQKLNLHEALKKADKAEFAAHLAVSKCIEELRDHELQLHMCTQKEEEEGWKKELLKSKKQKKDETTQAKLDAIFQVARSARAVEEELNMRETSIQNLKRKVEQLAEWRELTEKSLKQRESVKDEMEAKHKWKQKVADEKRRWRVEFFTPSGKPDKLKSQCSKYWTRREKLASDKEEQVYSGGALDILAEVPPSTKHDFVLMLQLLEQSGIYESDGTRSVLSTQITIKLQNHTNQVALFDDVFRPVEEILSKYTTQMGELAAPLSTNKVFTSASNSGANPNEEGNTIMNEKGWKVDSGHVNLQDEGQTMDATYEDEMPPHSSSPHSIVRQSSSYSQTLGGDVMDLNRRSQPFRSFAERYGAAASLNSAKGPPSFLGSYSSLDPLQSDSKAKMRWRNRQMHILAEMDNAKESTSGVNAKEPKLYELMDKLENEKYKVERYRSLDSSGRQR